MALVLQRGCDTDARRGLEVGAVCSSSGGQEEEHNQQRQKKKKKKINHKEPFHLLSLALLPDKF